MTTLTPYELTHTISNVSIHELEKGNVRVRGQYHDKRGGPSYGYYYDRLIDEAKECWLTLRVAENLKPDLKSGMVYELEGRVERRIINHKELGVFLYFNLSKVVGVRPPMIDSRVQEKAGILRDHYARKRRDVDLVLGNLLESRKRPRIAMISGEGAVTEADIMRALGNREDKYQFAKFPINLSDKRWIIETLQELDEERDYDLIAMYRGGGSGLETFDDLDIARAVVNLKTPFVTAIGHATDTPFIQDVADRHFTTPTNFGTYLKEIADKYIREAYRLKKYHEQEQEHLQIIKGLRADKDRLQNEVLRMSRAQQDQMPAQIAEAFRRRLIVWLLVAMICGATIGVAASYVYVRLLLQATSAANTGSPDSNEQVPSNSAGTFTNSNSQNVDKKRRGGR